MKIRDGEGGGKNEEKEERGCRLSRIVVDSRGGWGVGVEINMFQIRKFSNRNFWATLLYAFITQIILIAEHGYFVSNIH